MVGSPSCHYDKSEKKKYVYKLAKGTVSVVS